MAEAESITLPAEIVRELDCKVCLERKRLHLLPCSHRCCKQCIDRLVEISGHIACPMCRKEAEKPEGGFPVCLLSVYLRDVIEQTGGAAESEHEKEAKCWSCKKSCIEARCRECKSLLCFRCNVAKETCTSVTGKHLSDPIDQVIRRKERALKLWRTKIDNEIAKSKARLEHLEEEADDLRKDIADKEAQLKASEFIEAESDKAVLIRVVEQICVHESLDLPESVRTSDDLEFVSTFHSKYVCNTVHHHSLTGEILLGSPQGVHKLYKPTGSVANISTAYPHAQALEHKGVIFIASVSNFDQKLTVFKYSLASTSSKMLFSFAANHVPDEQYRTAVCDHYIVCWDVYNQGIKLFVMQTNELMTHFLPKCDQLLNLRMKSNGILYAIVLCDDKCFLNMYYLDAKENHEPILVWSCPVPRVSSLALTHDDLIVLCGKKTKRFYIVGPTGNMLSEFRHNSIPNNIQDISLRGTELVMVSPKLESSTLAIFKLQLDNMNAHSSLQGQKADDTSQ